MADLVGKQIGNYHVIRLLGMGAFASTYLAEHILTKRQVAIEILPDLQTDESLARFRAEAHLTSRLRHPHIVQTLDFGLESSPPFIVTDYAPNGSLRQHHPNGSRVPIATVVSYVKQVAEALQYVHDLELIHRDVKPENMLLGRNDEVLLSDFGIAVIAHSSQSFHTEVAGTVAYMAPEQLQGKPLPASDQYSLGIVVYEWLCGGRPFEGSLIEVASQHMLVPPPPLRERVSTISAQVEAVVMKALAKDPGQRFASVREFAEALERAYLSSLAGKCPYCGANTRPGDNFCLNCGNRLFPATPSPQQAQPAMGNATIAYRPEPPGRRASVEEENLPTIAAPFDAAAQEQIYRTREDESMTAAASDEEFLTRSMDTSIVAAGPPVPSVSSSAPASAVPGTAWTNKDTDIKALTPAEGASSQDTTRVLSLFAIARATLEDDNGAFVGKVYTIQTGIAQRKPEGFAGEPFKLPLRSNIRFLFLEILLHTSSNIQLISYWHRRLRYDSHSSEPQLVEFKFRVIAPGKCSLSVDYYYERRWLRTIHFRFDAVEQLELTTVLSED